MVQFIREIYPVGQGGFTFEQIGDYSVVYDCGSKGNLERVKQFIGDIQKYTDHVNRLYISHFDKDHVNGIKQLLEKVTVGKAIIPSIPREYRVVFNLITGGAYESLRSLFVNGDNTRLIEVDEKEDIKKEDRWEWISRPMFNSTDWTNLSSSFAKASLDIPSLSDAQYVEKNKSLINDCFKDAFGSLGPNSKGLIMLSQMITGTIVSNKLTSGMGEVSLSNETAALFVGDAHVKGKRDVGTVQAFLGSHLKGNLLLAQIPHHGSQYNSGWNYDNDIKAKYYYYQHTSDEKLKKNTKLYGSLMKSKNLIDVRDIDSDLVRHTVEIG